MIEEEFVKKGKVEEGILSQELFDMDGFGNKQTSCVSIIGGFIG